DGPPAARAAELLLTVDPAGPLGTDDSPAAGAAGATAAPDAGAEAEREPAAAEGPPLVGATVGPGGGGGRAVDIGFGPAAPRGVGRGVNLPGGRGLVSARRPGVGAGTGDPGVTGGAAEAGGATEPAGAAGESCGTATEGAADPATDDGPAVGAVVDPR
ncbi:MAG TPA: hypothetical protein VNF73_09975, partial [Candidatus Saccharimonadales bacterium]|nr:hypothetical protein [Candidatus Saccharimonadales bacterium]